MSNQDQEEVILGEGRFVRLVRRAGWEFLRSPSLHGVVVIAAVTEADRLLLVEQFRVPLNRRTLELPAGMVGDKPGPENSDFALAARRELLEETGYEAATMRLLFAGPAAPGRTDTLYTFYRASGLVRRHEGGGDEDEDIVVHEAPLATIDTWLDERAREGLLLDPKIYTGLYCILRERA